MHRADVLSVSTVRRLSLSIGLIPVVTTLNSSGRVVLLSGILTTCAVTLASEGAVLRRLLVFHDRDEESTPSVGLSCSKFGYRAPNMGLPFCVLPFVILGAWDVAPSINSGVSMAVAIVGFGGGAVAAIALAFSVGCNIEIDSDRMIVEWRSLLQLVRFNIGEIKSIRTNLNGISTIRLSNGRTLRLGQCSAGWPEFTTRLSSLVVAGLVQTHGRPGGRRRLMSGFYQS